MKIEANRDFISFFPPHHLPLHHLRIQMFSFPNMGKKGSGTRQHHFLILWVDFLLPERLVSNLHLISFYVKRNRFVIGTCDHHRNLENAVKYMKKLKSFIVLCQNHCEHFHILFSFLTFHPHVCSFFYIIGIILSTQVCVLPFSLNRMCEQFLISLNNVCKCHILNSGHTLIHLTLRPLWINRLGCF